MNKDYGFKIVKQGSSINTTDIRDILSSSKYSMLKYYKDQTGSVTFTPGDTAQTADIQHNLGYVPAFIAYAKDMDGKMHYISAPPYPAGYDFYMYAYADTIKIRVGFAYGLTAYNYDAETATDWYSEYGGGATTFLLLGNRYGGQQHGALRFSDVDIPQGATITEAILNVAVEFKGSAGNLEAKIYGLDEDNTAAFGDPSGRPRTTAFDDASWSLPPTGEFSNHNVTAIVQEIVNRAGWVSGNAMGFYLLDDSSPTDVYIEDDYNTGIQSQLTVKYGSNTTLTFRTIIFKNKIA